MLLFVEMKFIYFMDIYNMTKNGYMPIVAGCIQTCVHICKKTQDIDPHILGGRTVLSTVSRGGKLKQSATERSVKRILASEHIYLIIYSCHFYLHSFLFLE